MSTLIKSADWVVAWDEAAQSHVYLQDADVAWDEEQDVVPLHVGRVEITLLNKPSSLGNLTTVIARNEGNITNLKITNRSTDFFDMLVDIEVRDLKHLSDILGAVRALPAVNSADRARG